MKEWWLAQSERDRRILAIGAVVATVAAFYSLLWEPLHQRSSKYQQLIQEQTQLLQWMQQRSTEAKQLMAGSPNRPKSKQGGTLLSLVDEQARKAGLGKGLKRVEPAGKGQVRLWFEEVAFNKLASWLGTLEKTYGTQVDSAVIDRGTSPGQVNARLVIKRERP